MPDMALATAPSEEGFHIEPVFSMPPGTSPDAFTSDGHAVAFSELSDGSLCLLWDGRAGAPFRGFMQLRDGTPSIYASPDGAHLAYAAGRDGMVFVGRDDLEYPPFQAFSRSVPPVFSHDGRHLAYGAGAADGDFGLVVDGGLVSTMPLAPIQVVFSPSGDRRAHVEMRPLGGRQREVRIVLDDTPGPWFSGMRNASGIMQFSPDSQRFAYQRVDGKGHAQWVLDDRAQRPIDEARSISLSAIRGIGVVDPPVRACFSPDSQRFVYGAVLIDGGVAILEDDSPGPRFKSIAQLGFSPDSRHLAYMAQVSSKSFCLVVDGSTRLELPRLSWVSSPVFSRDSGHVAVTYIREEGGPLRKRHVVGCVLDDRIISEVEADDVRPPLFSPDGARVAWLVGRRGTFDVMIDAALATTTHQTQSAPAFSSAGHLAIAVTTQPYDRWTVMLDGRLGPLAHELLVPWSVQARYEHQRTGEPDLPFVFSADGMHLAWAGIFGTAARPVLDDRLGPVFNTVVDWAFGSDGQAVWWAQQGDTVVRVTAAPDLA